MTDPVDDNSSPNTDTGNGNPPPKNPPKQGGKRAPSPQPAGQVEDDDTGNGNPPPKG